MKWFLLSLLLVSFVMISSQLAPVSAVTLTATNNTGLGFVLSLTPQSHFLNLANTSRITDGTLRVTFSGLSVGGLDIYVNGNLVGNVTTADSSPKVFTGLGSIFKGPNNNITYTPQIATTATVITSDMLYTFSPYVQSGEFNMTVLAQNITIDPVNMSNTFVIVSSRSQGSEGNVLQIMAELINSTVIEFSKFSTEDTMVVYQVIENPDFTVQRGTKAYATTDANLSIPITAINNSNTFPIVSGKLNSATASQTVRGYWQTSLNASAILNLTRGTTGSNGTVAWQVITWRGTTVVWGELKLVNLDYDENITLANAVNLSNTFLISDRKSTGTFTGQNQIRVFFANSTLINFDRGNSSNIADISYYIISEPNIAVQRGLTNYTTNALAVNATLTSVNVSRTFAVSTLQSTTQAAVDGRAYTTYRVINPTTLEFKRRLVSAQQSNQAWFAVSFLNTVTSNPDVAPPYFTGIPGSTNITYTQGFGVQFNATDAVSFGTFSINWTTLFTINSTGFLRNTTQLPAGFYAINVTINDTAGNRNSTIYNVTVNKALSACPINTNSPTTYPNPVNVTGNCTNPEATPQLFRDEVLVSLPYVQVLGAGTYTFKINVTATQNYTSSENLSIVVVNRGLVTPTLYLNTSERDLNITFPSQVNASTNSSVQSVQLFRNGVDVTATNNAFVGLAAGFYNFTVLSYGNANYSNATITRFANVSRATTICSLITNSPVTYPSAATVNGNCTNPEALPVLFRDEVVVANPFSQVLKASSYTFKVNVTQTENYTSGTASDTVTVNKGAGNVNTLVNGQQSDITLQTGFPLQMNVTLQTGFGNIQLYFNTTLINSGASPLSNTTSLLNGLYNVTGVYPGNENYTSDFETWFVTVQFPSNSTGTGTATPVCKYTKFGYYNTELPWIRQSNCIIPEKFGYGGSS